MVDAATGGRSVFGRAIEKVNLGVPSGAFAFLNFDSEDISRMDEENPSAAITGNDGADRGTPGDIKFDDKLKYAMTPSRFLFDAVVMFGKPTSSEAISRKVASLIGGLGGSLYAIGDELVFAGGAGSGAKGHVSGVSYGIASLIGGLGGYNYAISDPLVFTGGAGTGAAGHVSAIDAYISNLIGGVGGTLYAVDDPLVFTGGAGSGAAGRVSSVDLGTGAITGLELTNGGHDYLPTDTVTFTVSSLNGTGNDAGTTTLQGGRIKTLALTAEGGGYLSTDTPTFTVTSAAGSANGPGTTTLVGGDITALTLDSGGTGYLSTDTVTFTITSVSGTGASAGTTTLAVNLWLVKVRPGRSNELRAATLYLFEGGSYTPQVQYGRRAALINIADSANKRSEVDVTYADPTGDSISGFFVAKSTNGGSYAGKISSRGRRPYDANYKAKKSLYLKVTAVDAAKATFKTKFDTASPGDGSGFPSGTYGSTTFAAPIASDEFDGYSNAVDNLGKPIGLFAENFEAFEITVGPATTGLAVNDEFEIPSTCQELTKTTVPESRLSAFHLVRVLGETFDCRFDKGTTKLERPYKAYRANARRIPQAIDPMGDVKGVWAFSKRLFDRRFRETTDEHTRFSVHDKYLITDSGEAVEIFAGQCAVTGLKSGDIASKNVLEESVTLSSEQPESVGSPPPGFDGTYPLEVNISTSIDPSFLS
jgi:hypothetical protein